MRRILRDEEWDNDTKFEELLRFDQVNTFHRISLAHSIRIPSQLRKAMNSGSAFLGFHEGTITHMPFVFCCNSICPMLMNFYSERIDSALA